MTTTIDKAQLAGQPTIKIGRELGIFIYYTESDDRWHIRWNGDEKDQRVTKYYLWQGVIIADNISNVQPYRIDRRQDEGFNLTPANDVLSFHGVVFSDIDGLDFTASGDMRFILFGRVTDRSNRPSRKQFADFKTLDFTRLRNQSLDTLLATDEQWQRGWGENILSPADIYFGPNKIPATTTQFTISNDTSANKPSATIYWGNTWPSAIKRAADDSTTSVSDFQTLAQTPFGLAVDSDERVVYWGDGVPSINRASADGGASVQVAALDFTPYGLALDTTKQCAYCADQNGGAIWRVDLNTGKCSQVIDGLKLPTSVALDVDNQRLYWTAYRGNSIQCCSADGSNLKTIVSDLSQPQSIAVDSANNLIVWAAKFGLQSAELDGKNPQLNLIPLPQAAGNTASRSVALDTVNQHIYWIDQANDSMQRSNLDGSAVTTFLSNLSSPSQLAILS